jgi:putative transposase
LTGSKKNLDLSIEAKRSHIDIAHPKISVTRQCQLLGLNRSSFYYQGSGPKEGDLEMMRLIDEKYLKYPFLGSRKMAEMLGRDLDISLNRKRMQRLMRIMGIEAIYPRPNLSNPDKSHKIYPYLLRNIAIDRPNFVWSTDITYIPLEGGFAYLVAVIDWFSRLVLSWRLSNTMTADFCVDALQQALKLGKPEIFNTDQGSQFTSNEFTGVLASNDIKISMDGKGRALDNIFIERLWRSVKYENVYINGYREMLAAELGIGKYFDFYNTERPHQSLSYLTPWEVHYK